MKISTIKRLVKEEFKKEYDELIEKLAYVINPVFEQLKGLMDNGITLADNVNCDIKDITVIVDATGAPIPALQVALRAKSLGLIVMRAIPSSPSAAPTAAVYVHYEEGSNVITIKKITGLQQNTKYTVRLVIFYG